ncbi:hypothetical protein [Cumulibacter soli]|uniref:hypothetical protein n=1 Tax=Cumulibacter soli TaxID=2546344 RepID=UPI001067F116|nr:hypothetical protein [Cumulibacter soli]
MKIAAWLTTWIGIALIGLLGWVVPWVTNGPDEGGLITAAQAIDNAPGRAGVSAIPAFYATTAWIVIGGLIAATGLFAMFSGARDRWIAVIGYVLGAAFLGLGAFNTWGGASRSSSENLSFIGVLVAGALMLVMAVLSTRGAAFIGAVPAALAALVGLAWSIWFVAAAPQTEVLSVSTLGWALPAAHLLALIGSLLSIAIAGRNKAVSPASPNSPAAA